ncbi:MAG: tripartite tricarboxylate transporter TctB family protein [Janthinobacterium lividum]
MRSERDVAAGLLFIGIGLGAGLEVSRYPIGTLTAMGPGYFPLILSAGLVLLGIASVAKGLLREGPAVPRQWPLVPLFMLVAGIAAFGWLIEASGLLAAVFVLAIAISYRELPRHPAQVIGSAIVLSGAAALLFVHFLGMPFAAF